MFLPMEIKAFYVVFAWIIDLQYKLYVFEFNNIILCKISFNSNYILADYNSIIFNYVFKYVIIIIIE